MNLTDWLQEEYYAASAIDETVKKLCVEEFIPEWLRDHIKNTLNWLYRYEFKQFCQSIWNNIHIIWNIPKKIDNIWKWAKKFFEHMIHIPSYF